VIVEDMRLESRYKGMSNMAKNGKPGKGRIGQIRDRAQTKNPRTGLWVKRDSKTGRFLDVKSDGTPFKGVRKEKGRS
jgi:hypothetical protein